MNTNSNSASDKFNQFLSYQDYRLTEFMINHATVEDVLDRYPDYSNAFIIQKSIRFYKLYEILIADKKVIDNMNVTYRTIIVDNECNTFDAYGLSNGKTLRLGLTSTIPNGTQSPRLNNKYNPMYRNNKYDKIVTSRNSNCDVGNVNIIYDRDSLPYNQNKYVVTNDDGELEYDIITFEGDYIFSYNDPLFTLCTNLYINGNLIIDRDAVLRTEYDIILTGIIYGKGTIECNNIYYVNSIEDPILNGRIIAVPPVNVVPHNINL